MTSWLQAHKYTYTHTSHHSLIKSTLEHKHFLFKINLHLYLFVLIYYKFWGWWVYHLSTFYASDHEGLRAFLVYYSVRILSLLVNDFLTNHNTFCTLISMLFNLHIKISWYPMVSWYLFEYLLPSFMNNSLDIYLFTIVSELLEIHLFTLQNETILFDIFLNIIIFFQDLGH